MYGMGWNEMRWDGIRCWSLDGWETHLVGKCWLAQNNRILKIQYIKTCVCLSTSSISSRIFKTNRIIFFLIRLMPCCCPRRLEFLNAVVVGGKMVINRQGHSSPTKHDECWNGKSASGELSQSRHLTWGGQHGDLSALSTKYKSFCCNIISVHWLRGGSGSAGNLVSKRDAIQIKGYQCIKSLKWTTLNSRSLKQERNNRSRLVTQCTWPPIPSNGSSRWQQSGAKAHAAKAPRAPRPMISFSAHTRSQQPDFDTSPESLMHLAENLRWFSQHQWRRFGDECGESSRLATLDVMHVFRHNRPCSCHSHRNFITIDTTVPYRTSVSIYMWIFSFQIFSFSLSYFHKVLSIATWTHDLEIPSSSPSPT